MSALRGAADGGCGPLTPGTIPGLPGRRSCTPPMTIALIVIAVLVVLLLVYLIAVYNGLIRRRNQIENAWAQIDVQLKRRLDLIPNLVETVKGYASPRARDPRRRDQGPQRGDAAPVTPDDQAAADNQLTGALRQVFALSEAYPDLKANQNFLALQEELTATEGRIAYAWQFYNDSVLKYNNKLAAVPHGRSSPNAEVRRARVLRGRRGRPEPCRPSSSDARDAAAATSLGAARPMFEQIGSNKRRTVALIAAFVLILAARRAPSPGYLAGFGLVGRSIAAGDLRRGWPSPRTGRRTRSRWP